MTPNLYIFHDIFVSLETNVRTLDKITHVLENDVRCKYLKAGVHIKNPIKNSYQDGLRRTTPTLDSVVVGLGINLRQ